MAEIPKAYEPQSVENRWYQFWLDERLFVADPKSPKPAFSIVIPPPNVTGVLHMGHVLNNTVQDILARKARMDGKEVLWLPGTDHAGIATQVVVEKQLKKEEKKTRFDLGREEFLKRAWAWKEKHGSIIIEQLKKLGCSCDWSRERFTMDPEYSRCVQKVFVDLYKKGLIYRGKRMVNWCPATLTALSDEEVEMEPQKGFLWHFRVEIAEEPGKFLTIVTTRPETIPGDTAIAVNPKDPRYTSFIGKHAIRPLPVELPPEKKLIPIIADEHVDFEFGTGVLKVTPAHDKADFEIGQRHNLPAGDVMNPNGTMNDLAGADLAELDRFEARKVAAEKLKELGALVKEEPYENKVGFSQRAHVPIEPRLSEQWFLKYPSQQEALTAVRGRDLIKFRPAHWADVYVHWMLRIQDWCISRQLWWGHRIPVWYDRMAWAAFGESITVVELSGRELAGGNARELRRDAWQLATPSGFLRQRFKNLDTGWDIYVNRKSLEHGFANQGLVNILLVPALPELLNTAVLYGSEAHVPGIPQVRAVHKFVGALRVADHLYRVKFTVKELLDGKKLYDHQAVAAQENEADGNSPGTHLREEKLVTRPASAPQIKVAALFGNVNSDEQYIRCQIDSPGEAWQQDPDVLDTWCSSWLWPFATMGWTGDKEVDAKNETLKKFYPTTDLVTAPEIIFFWVARMIMAGCEYMGNLPFRNVYFTGIVRDKQGRKMSKSLGNSPDPLELIAKYGADAVRFGTMRSAPLGQDVLFDEKDVELGRNFCNKLWNACRFRQMQGGESQGEIDPARLRSDEKWILLKLDNAIRELTDALAGYRFSEATQTIYRFFWSEFCDWYLETTKAVLQAPRPAPGDQPTQPGVPSSLDEPQKANTLAVIDFVLSHTLRFLNPFLPFITEELWHGMGYHEDMPPDQGGRSIMHAPWPKPLDSDFKDHYGLDDCYLEMVDAKYEFVTQGRNLRREANVPLNKKARYVLKPSSPVPANDLRVLELLLNAEALVLQTDYQPPKGTPTVHSTLGELYLPLEGLVDLAAEKARLAREIEKATAEIAKVQQKLNNPAFMAKAPARVLEENQKVLADWQAKKDHLQRALDGLSGA